jgi:hypothetical protein
MRSDFGYKPAMFQIPESMKSTEIREIYNYQILALKAHARGQNLAYSAISEPVIEPLSLLGIPENRIDCIFSCFSNFHETLHCAFVSEDFRQKGNI